jgi:hypothetical protein
MIEKLKFAWACFLMAWRMFPVEISVEQFVVDAEEALRNVSRFKVLAYSGPKRKPAGLYDGHSGSAARQHFERNQQKFWRLEFWDRDVLRGLDEK